MTLIGVTELLVHLLNIKLMGLLACSVLTPEKEES